MTKLSELHQKWLENSKYQEAFNAMEAEFNLAQALIETRTRIGLTQEALAQRMKTTQSVIARMESGKSLPSASTLKKFAEATGTRLKISFEPFT
jgi:ribosome-binding protein aMBF1 (putative translation factor)